MWKETDLPKKKIFNSKFLFLFLGHKIPESLSRFSSMDLKHCFLDVSSQRVTSLEF